jgi:hypothetical protein
VSEKLRPFPVKDTSWSSLDFSTEYMEHEHDRLVRRDSALTFVPFPPEWNAAASTGFTGQRYEKSGGDGEE